MAGATLSFDMQVVSNSVSSFGDIINSRVGVTLSFLNSFNTSLGSASLVNATNPSSLGPHDSLIDGVQHNYTNSLSDYVTLAGLGARDPISKVSLTYFATGATNTFGASSSSKVWFDNVNFFVPVPAAVWLFGSGLLGLTGVARRKKA